MDQNLAVQRNLTEVYAPLLKSMRDRWTAVFGVGTEEWRGFNALYHMVEDRNSEITREENKLKAKGEYKHDRSAE
jgi:hypothetical protein